MENIMTDKKQCTHPSWKAIPNAKVQCEACGAVGVELRYLQPDSSEQASQPQWIPVRERLPEETAFYLTYVLGTIVAGKRVPIVLKYMASTHAFYSHNLGMLINGVTHWMPLPALPKSA